MPQRRQKVKLGWRRGGDRVGEGSWPLAMTGSGRNPRISSGAQPPDPNPDRDHVGSLAGLRSRNVSRIWVVPVMPAVRIILDLVTMQSVASDNASTAR
jgi:hypothetical protein